MYMQIRMPLACLLILAYTFLHYMRKPRLQTIASKIFEAATVGALLHILSAVVTEYTVNNRDIVPAAFNYIWHLVFFLTLSFTCMMVYVYLLCQIERRIGRKKLRERSFLYVIYTICILAELIAPIEYIDTPNGSYSLGMKAYFLYLIVIYIMVMMTANIIRHHKVLDKRMLTSFIYAVVIFISASLIQMIFPHILLTDLGVSLFIIGLMENTEEPALYVLPESGLYNEAGCQELLLELLSRHKQVNIGVCVFIGESTASALAAETLGCKLKNQDKTILCGQPKANVLLLMPKSKVYKKLAQLDTIPEAANEAGCHTTILQLESAQGLDAFFHAIQQFQNECHEKEHHTDELTGLLRRAAYTQRVNRMIAEKHAFALVMIDLDDFKHINDTYGHGAGDEVLIYAATVFRANIRATDLSCRMGGDEFSLVLADLSNEKVLRRLLAKMTAKMKDTVLSDGTRLEVTLSIGVTIHHPEEGDCSFEELYRASDAVLYQAKKGGKNRICIK